MRVIALVFISVFGLVFSSADAVSASASFLSGKFTVDGSERAETVAGAAGLWEFNFSRRDGEPQRRFKKGHGKEMHLLVIKDDLSEFVHVHPTLVGESGRFLFIANQETTDPDNYFARSVTPTPGQYFVVTEVFPDRGQLTPVPEIYNFNLRATGAEARERQAIVSDEKTPQGNIVKYFNVSGKAKNWWERNNPRVEFGAYGDQYEASLRIDTVLGCGGNQAEFVLSLRKYDKDNEQYLPVQDLQTWLRMQGHAILISTEEAAIEDKFFAHLHAMAHGTHSDLVFRYFDRKVLSGRQFKLWAQMKHDDFVLTIPFVFDYNADYEDSCLPGAAQPEPPADGSHNGGHHGHH